MANTDFSVLLKAELDRAGIDTDLKKVQEIVKKYHLELTPDLQTASLKNQFKSVCKEMANDFNKAFNANVSGNDVFKVYENKAKQLQQTLQQANKIQLSTDVTKLTTDYQKFGVVSQEVENNLKELKLAQEAVVNAKGTDRLATEIEKYDTALGKAKSSLKELTTTQVSMNQRTSQLTSMQEWMRKNKAATKLVGDQVNKLIEECKTCDAVRFNGIKNEFKELQVQAGQAGKLGNSLFSSLKEQAKSFTQWISVSGLVMEGVQTARQMYQAVIDVNSAMIELRKVSDASDNEIKNYFDEAAESAKRFGSSVSDMINATADWSRLGYNLPDSKQLAEVATLYKNVGDGIDIDSANQSLISTLQGFQLEAKDAMSIIDQFNEVANNFPIDSAGIGEALQRSAASLYAANTDLSKSIALITGTNAVVQDPSSVGNMWKTVSMRIRGTKQELEAAGEDVDGMVESTSKLRDIIKGLTGFDIMADKAGTQFKDVYDIVVGIGKEWKNLSDIEQAGLLEALAGKRQGNALSAALNNISMIENAYDTATNSAGSALKEQQEYEKGIQYSLDRLTASAQTFANHFLDSSLVKGIVDFGNTTINVIDKITSALTPLGTLTLGGGIFAGFKNIGRPKMFGLYKYADINMCSLGY